MFRFADSLECEDIENFGLFLRGSSDCDRWSKASRPKDSVQSRLYRLKLSLAKRGRPSGLESFTPANLRHTTALDPRAFEGFDVINIHYIGGLLWNIDELFQLVPKETKLFVTMHDLNFITGGCHYPDGCSAYLNGCERCPQLPGVGGASLCRRSFEIKAQTYASRDFSIIAPSKWLYNCATQSRLGSFAKQIELIRNPFRLSRSLLSRQECRANNFSDVKEKWIVLVIAQNPNIARKGFALVVDILKKNLLDSAHFVMMGSEIDFAHPRLPQLGFVSDRDKIRRIYASANVLALPSIEENLAQTGLEALREGTPVVCFENTGPQDYTIEGETGVVCPQPTSGSLAEGLLRCLSSPMLASQEHVRAVFKRLYDKEYKPEVVRRNYSTLFQKS